MLMHESFPLKKFILDEKKKYKIINLLWKVFDKQEDEVILMNINLFK